MGLFSVTDFHQNGFIRYLLKKDIVAKILMCVFLYLYHFQITYPQYLFKILIHTRFEKFNNTTALLHFSQHRLNQNFCDLLG